MASNMVKQALMICVACAIVLSLLTSTALHSIIAHDHAAILDDAPVHGHGAAHAPQSENREVSVVWASLHGALHHEERYATFLLGLIELLLLILILRYAGRLSDIAPYERELPHDYQAERWLVAGLAPYRRFS